MFLSLINGNKRELGDRPRDQVYVQFDVTSRENLHHFKGASLAVFMAIALHADRDGWAFPSQALLAKEIGYSEWTVKQAIASLCELEIDGARVLLRVRAFDMERGKLTSNRYLVLPSPEEVEQYAGETLHVDSKNRVGALSGEQGVGFLPVENPPIEQGVGFLPVENPPIKQRHATEEKTEEKKEEEQPAAKQRQAAAGSPSDREIICSIHNTPMGRRERDGDVWYSHRLPNGTWCKGAPKDREEQHERRPDSRGQFAEFINRDDKGRIEEERLAEWQAILDAMQLQMTRQTFDHLFAHSAARHENGRLIVTVRSEQVHDMLANRERLAAQLAATVERVLGEPTAVELCIAS